MIVANPDPSKYVLSNWGDISILGKRKTGPKGVSDEVDDVYPLDNGIQVTVDTAEFDYDEEALDDENNDDPVVVQNNTSSDEELLLGEMAASATRTASKYGGLIKKKPSKPVTVDKSVKPGCSSDMTEEEKKLLQENPHMQSIVNKLLDQRLKNIMPQSGSILTGNVEAVQQGKSSKMEKRVVSDKMLVVKSPSDTTIHICAHPE